MKNDEKRVIDFANNNNANKPMQITPEVIDAAPAFDCSCGCLFWQEAVMLKQISRLISPSGKDLMQPVQALICVDCGKPYGLVLEERAAGIGIPDAQRGKNEGDDKQ